MAECNHEWECEDESDGEGGVYRFWKCALCGKYRGNDAACEGFE